MKPQLNIEPRNYIMPLLHLLISVVNKAWSCLVYFFDKFVENISSSEAAIKDNITEYETELVNIENELEILIVNKNMTYAVMHENPTEKEVLKPLIMSLKSTSVRG